MTQFPSEKKCFKCGESKKLVFFYKHPQMKDGRLNKCKECTKRDCHQNRKKNLEARRLYDRKRAKLPHRRALAVRINKRLRQADPRYLRAHNAAHRAIVAGKLIRGPCEVCGSTDKIHGHHPDYDKPLEVTWLCSPCHKAAHDK